MTLEPGLSAAFRYTVTHADTAVAVGSGEVPVLATPRVLALAERATVAAVARALEAGSTTVGTRVELDHLAPSPVGGRTGGHRGAGAGGRAAAAVRRQAARCGRAVARGLIIRVVVEVDGFLRDAGAEAGAGR